VLSMVNPHVVNAIKTTAEYYQRGLLLGLDILSDAMVWIDAMLITEPDPDIALIEASLCGSKGAIAVADWLAQVPGEADKKTVSRRLLSGMLARIDHEPEAALQVAYWLYCMAADEELPDLAGEGSMWLFWDDFDLAVKGINGDLEALHAELRGFLLRAALLTEVTLFQQWADAEYPDGRFGEWECDYSSWDRLWRAVREFVTSHPFASWSEEEIRAVLYALARDNETGEIADALEEDLLVPLTQASLACGERDARWQLAQQLGRREAKSDEAARVLLALAHDADEYVRRITLDALAQIGSTYVEGLALEMWERADPNQQYARIMVLSCLQKVGSPQLKPLLAEAERDTRPYLRAAAERIRKGDKV
jgi:hypothetical protein